MNRFSVVDAQDGFFLLHPGTQELLKFHTNEKIYKIKVLAMGMPPVSREWHVAMSKILMGLRGIEVIKDDIIVHGKGWEHNKNLDV